MIKNLLNSPRIIFHFSKQTIGRWRYRLSSVIYNLIKHAFSNNQSARNIGQVGTSFKNKSIIPSSCKSHIEITWKGQALRSSAELAGK